MSNDTFPMDWSERLVRWTAAFVESVRRAADHKTTTPVEHGARYVGMTSDPELHPH